MLDANLSANELQQAIYDQPSTTSHLRQAIYNKPSTTSHLRKAIYDQPSTTSHLRPAVYDLKDGKSSGMDGFIAEFYNKLSYLIKDRYTEFINYANHGYG